MNEQLTLGFAMCGSFCTFNAVLTQLEAMRAEFPKIIPIMSTVSYETDTRFGTAADFRARLESACGQPVIHTIAQAEPIGPKKLLDVLVIAPCTGNTLAKLAHGMTDSAVTMAAKAHLRNGKPLVIAFSTNDGLSGSAENIARLLNRKNVYFVPFGQDDPAKKPRSLQSDFELIGDTVEAALRGWQLQPILRK